MHLILEALGLISLSLNRWSVLFFSCISNHLLFCFFESPNRWISLDEEILINDVEEFAFSKHQCTRGRTSWHRNHIDRHCFFNWLMIKREGRKQNLFRWGNRRVINNFFFLIEKNWETQWIEVETGVMKNKTISYSDNIL